MRLLLALLLLVSLPVLLHGRGGRGGAGRGRGGSRGGSRTGGSWGYSKGSVKHSSGHGSLAGSHHNYHGSGGGRHMVQGGSSGNGAPYIRKTTSSFYRYGTGSVKASTVAKTSIAVAAYPLATHVFGANVIRERESPIKVDGHSYYWSAGYVTKSNISAICSLPIETDDTLFSNITFTNLEKVNEIAWSCVSTSYCCGLTCCSGGYEGVPLGPIGKFGVSLLSLTVLLIPGVALVRTGQRAMSSNDCK